MIAFLAACTSGCTRAADCPGGGNLTGAGKRPVLTTRRLLLAETEDADDDEDAAIEGWLKKNSSLTRWLWYSRFVRLEQGPRLLSFYRSHIWQGCRRDGAFDLTCLVRVHVVEPQWVGRNVELVMEFAQSSPDIPAGTEPVETIRLKVPGGTDVARDWEQHLVESMEFQLLEACEQCLASEPAVDRAVQILSRAQHGEAESRSDVDVDRRRQQGSRRTSLMLAAQSGHERLCSMLLFARASAALTDADGQTATQLAHSAGHAKIVSLLIEGVQGVSPMVLGRSDSGKNDMQAIFSFDRLPTPARV